MKGNEYKVYIRVAVEFNAEGVMLPRCITWEDGRKFPVDRVKDIRQAASLKAGGQGDRYTVLIGGQEVYLYFERDPALYGNHIGKWFVERRG